ncbi:alpha-1,6-mannosyl-glycoprotein 2-beta-N-acetylglucosaminyltransferase [Pygocentrus nattereri]|uniref:alpha-1,6-mannosyl-glycoprotein 2-beta-N-acetylglucosaminyltransferase n=1 Tax=Pygocentrus nattereri TaxID=42514 RepID=UPI0008146119|nr:alpha-1,6-mannosyl-glycoprotein 2-beta-N-acetylglucosaminyltransferase [Pygocentrus nattereri]XP_017542683.1 alpha-1,6-mannosyl-glycoprotein 2-beta-N-acetylglucosaminyltransferase [Pygocentrus nattereri]
MRLRLLKKNVAALLIISVILFVLFYSKFVITNERVVGENVPREGTQAVAINTFQYGTFLNMRKSVYDSNYRQFVQNGDKFPDEPEVVIVVQVHNRPAYLKMLIQSLEKAAEIHKFFVVFSHDYFSEEISDLVKGITFCKVLQIQFPYSKQLYPNEFPGQDPQDCPRDISKENAKKRGCINAEYPDTYGHYREASITQTKHHWWWKLHFVFERVKVLQGYKDFAVFIEEDNYILPDFYQFFKSMTNHRKSHCEDCDLLALGNHDGVSRFVERSAKTETSGWMSTKHNIGMGISRDVYYKLMGCNSEFCTYDDYNWDWTLQNLSGTCIQKPLKVLVACGTRVLHTGDCGLHQKDTCHPDLALQKVETDLREVTSALFPQTLTLTGHGPVEHKPHMKNGGWGDVRDHTLCINYAARL